MSPSARAARPSPSPVRSPGRSTPSPAGRSRRHGGTNRSSASTGRPSSTTPCCASSITTFRATNGSSSGCMTEAPYVELHSHSNSSFLDGGSHPYELAMRAAELEMPALAITDHGGVYGAVRHLQACRKLGVKPIIGSALEVDGEELILIARNLSGYSNLCRLLSHAHADQPKGEARTTLAKAAEHRGDLFYLSATDGESRLRGLQEALGKSAGVRRRPRLSQGQVSRLSGAERRDALLISLQALLRGRPGALQANHSRSRQAPAARAGGDREDRPRRVLPDQLGPHAICARPRRAGARPGLRR